jgi:hypothetical protein
MPTIVVGRRVEGSSVEGAPEVAGEARLYYLTQSGKWSLDRNDAHKFSDSEEGKGKLNIALARLRASSGGKFRFWTERT